MKVFHQGLLDAKELELSLKFFMNENSLSQEKYLIQKRPNLIRNLFLLDIDEIQELLQAAVKHDLKDLLNEIEIAQSEINENQLIYKLKLDEFRGRSS